MSLPRLLVVGSLNMDFVVRVERLPAPGQTWMGRGFATIPGGKGANQACAAGKLGAGKISVQMAGRVGRDVFADALKASLTAHHVDVTLVEAVTGQPTGTAFVWVDDRGQNSIVVVPGANFLFPTAEAGKLAPHLNGCRWVLFQLETPLDTIAELLRMAREAGTSTLLDPAPAQALSPDLLRSVDLITPNESEALTLLGRPLSRVGLTEAPGLAEALLQLGPKAVIVKLGDQGCVYADSHIHHVVPAFPVNAIDSTAAGDTFNAALAVALTEGQPMPAALRFANAAAALSVTRAGAQSSIPERSEVDALLVEYSA